jgi:hypothetical protein
LLLWLVNQQLVSADVLAHMLGIEQGASYS